MFGRSVTLDCSFDHCNDIHGSHRPPYVRSQALLGMFVDQGQYPKRRAFLGLIMHKIPAPYLVGSFGSLTHCGRHSQPFVSALLLPYLHAFFPSSPLLSFPSLRTCLRSCLSRHCLISFPAFFFRPPKYVALLILRLAHFAFTVVASASFSTPIISSSLNRLLFISFCSFYLSRTTLFNCPLFRDQANRY